jgi:8-oxo-dGTP pyrophosphatase MutT (NUDIX family)
MVAGSGDGGKVWRRLSTRELLRTGVFTVCERRSESPDGRAASFTVLDCPDWATVVPLLDGPEGPSFLMVRQYRHGSDSVSLEFPGGVVEAGEAPLAAAARELAEETGYSAGRIVEVGSPSPNPAIMSNSFHVFLATGLKPSGSQDLDEHEIVDALVVPAAEVRAGMGRPPYTHALMACALFLAERAMEGLRDGT